MQFQQFVFKIRIAVLALAINAPLHAQDSHAHLWSFPDFSATEVLQSKKADISMKVHYSGSSVRVERSPALSILFTPSSERVYNLTTYPDNSRQCVAMKTSQAKMLPSPLDLLQGSSLKRTSAGQDIVNGHPCQIENVIVTRPDGKTVESKVWEAEDMKGIPVRIESHVAGVTLTAEYRDISIGTPDQSLFTVPERCTPLEKMGQVAEQRTLR